MPTLSIIIPAYNEEAVLGACLDSLAAQTVPPDQVIVVDNNSTDRTAEIASSYPFVTLVKEPTQGIAYARDAGFKAATSTLMARTDSDAVFTKTWVAQVKKFYENPARADTTLVGTGYLYNLRFPKLTMAVSNSSFKFLKGLLGHWPGWGPNMIVPRHVWEHFKDGMCPEPYIHEDLDLTLHLHAAGYQIAWDRHLVVSTKVRHFDSFLDYYHYLLKAPATLKKHKLKSWVVDQAMVYPALLVQYPMLRLLEKPDPQAKPLPAK